jgi:tight adherence protein B
MQFFDFMEIGLVFVFVFYWVFSFMQSTQKSQRILKRLQGVSAARASQGSAFQTIFKESRESTIKKKMADYIKSTQETKTASPLKAIFLDLTFRIVLVIVAITAFLVFYFLYFFFRQDLGVSLLLTLLAIGATSTFTHNFVENKRKNLFLKNFPTALDIIMRGLRAGLPLEKTFSTVVSEVEGPISSEFKYITEKMELGVSFTEILADSARRVKILDYHFFASALAIQYNLGGSLADFMENVAGIIRKRRELRLKIRAISSEAKTSGIIVGSLPVLTLLAVSYMNPSQLEIFRYDPTGKKLLLIAISLLVLGVISLYFIAKVDVDS